MSICVDSFRRFVALIQINMCNLYKKVTAAIFRTLSAHAVEHLKNYYIMLFNRPNHPALSSHKMNIHRQEKYYFYNLLNPPLVNLLHNEYIQHILMRLPF